LQRSPSLVGRGP